ncbi:hypothetical protein A8F72_32025 [Burkholderia cenocepacia]|nr:hypothetical protein A8F72_32025 [Burkholderia cenocepacia]
MNRTLHILSCVSKSMVGLRSGIGSDSTAHAFLGGRSTRSGQPVHAARSLRDCFIKAVRCAEECSSKSGSNRV